MVALHSTLGLRTLGSDDLDAELLAHAPELRVCCLALGALVDRRLPLVHVLPVRVECSWYAVRLDPRLKYRRRGPGRLFIPKAQKCRALRVVDHAHHAA